MLSFRMMLNDDIWPAVDGSKWPHSSPQPVMVSAQYAREELKKTSVLDWWIFGQFLHVLTGQMNLAAWHLQIKRRCATQYG